MSATITPPRPPMPKNLIPTTGAKLPSPIGGPPTVVEEKPAQLLFPLEVEEPKPAVVNHLPSNARKNYGGRSAFVGAGVNYNHKDFLDRPVSLPAILFERNAVNPSLWNLAVLFNASAAYQQMTEIPYSDNPDVGTWSWPTVDDINEDEVVMSDVVKDEKPATMGGYPPESEPPVKKPTRARKVKADEKPSDAPPPLANDQGDDLEGSELTPDPFPAIGEPVPPPPQANTTS